MAVILVVDDRAINRQFLATLLGYCNHTVLEAGDGAEALAMIRKEAPHLIISDIMMPTMDGYELVREIRQDPTTSKIPLIFYTATYREKEARALAASCGVDHVLIKPSEPEQILQVVNSILGKTGAGAPLEPAPTMKGKDLGLLTDVLQETLVESRRTTTRLAALAELSLEMAKLDIIPRLMDAFTHGARDIIASGFSAVGVLSEDRGSLRDFWINGIGRAEAVGLGIPLPSEGAIGEVLVRSAPIRFFDPAKKLNPLEFPGGDFSVGSLLGVPLISREQVFGWLFFADKIGEDQFSHEDERLAVTLAAQFAVWYENARLHSDLEYHVKQLEYEMVQRSMAEQTLRKLSSAVEQSTDSVVITNKEGVIEYVNPGFVKLTGYSKEETIGQTPRLLKSGLYDPSFYAGLWRTILSGKVFRFQFTNKKKNGDLFYEEQTIVPLVNNGAITHFVSTGKDVTQRKHAESVLQEAEEQYRSIFDNSIDGIMKTSEDGRILAANLALARMLGYESAANLLARITDVDTQIYVHREDRKKVKDLLQQSDTLTGFETQFFKKDGSRIWVSINVRAVRRNQGKSLHYEGFVKDITERKTAQQAIRLGPLVLVVGISMLLFMAASELLESSITPIVGKNWASMIQSLCATAVAVIATVFAMKKQQLLYRQKLEEITERQKAQEALAESEDRFRQMADSISEVFWLSDPSTSQMLYVSPAYEKVWGQTCKSLYENPSAFLEAIHPDDRVRVFQDIEQKTTSGGFESEYRIIRPDGSIRWIWDRGFPVRDHAGNVVRVTGIAQDITEKKRHADALQQSEERFRLAFEEGPVGMTLIDQNLKFITTNKAYSEMVGYSQEELSKMTISDITHPEEVERDIASVARLFRGEIPAFRVQKRYIRKSGRILWVQLTSTLIHDSDGKAQYGFAMIENIHERKQAEERLAAEHAITRELGTSLSLEEAAPKILHVLCESLHWEFGALWATEKGMKVSQCLDIWHRPDPLFSEFENATRDLKIKRGEGLTGSVWQSGEPIWIADIQADARFGRAPVAAKAGLHGAYFFPVKSSNETYAVFEFFSREMREPDPILAQIFFSLGNQIGQFIERNKSEERKVQLEKQLAQSQKIEAIGQLAGGVAHDFNNTLMAISGFSELIVMQLPDNDPLWRVAKEIQKSTEHGANLTRQLLAFSRRQVLSPKMVDLNDSVKEMDGMLRRLIGEDIELLTTYSSDLGKIKADPGQIEQVLVNLAVNARDAMPKGGKLTIETANIELDEEYTRQHLDVAPGSYVQLAVSDTGIGMNEEVLSHLFEPFYTTKEEGKGTGLGLSTVYGIVKQSGAHISVYSQEGIGTTFKVYFSRINTNATSTRTSEAVTPGASGGGETILLVDDNDSIRKAVGEFLRIKGYTVFQAEHARAALQIAVKQDGNFELLITDLVMPEIGGRELAQRLRLSYPHVKVLYMSGYTEEAINRQGELDPGSVFLSKPVTMQNLYAKIREILGSHR